MEGFISRLLDVYAVLKMIFKKIASVLVLFFGIVVLILIAIIEFPIWLIFGFSTFEYWVDKTTPIYDWVDNELGI